MWFGLATSISTDENLDIPDGGFGKRYGGLISGLIIGRIVRLSVETA